MIDKVSYCKLNQKNYTEFGELHSQLHVNETTYLLAFKDFPRIICDKLDLKKKLNYLDFGCGAGLSTDIITKQLSQLGSSVSTHGLDINHKSLEIARKSYPNYHFFHPLTGESTNQLKMDIITCFFVLVELQSAEIPSILQQIKDWLAPNGIVLFVNASEAAYQTNSKWLTRGNNFHENIPKGELNTYDEDQPVKTKSFLTAERKQGFTFNDYFHSAAYYQQVFAKIGLVCLTEHFPLAPPKDNIAWRDERHTSPYIVHLVSQ